MTTHAAAMTADSRPLGELIEGFWITQLIGTTVALGIAEALGADVRSLDELASTCRLDRPSLLRLMRALQTVGVSVGNEERGYRLSEKGKVLRRDATASIYGRALFTSGLMWDLYRQLATVVQSGKPLQAGRQGFARLAHDPCLEGMHRAMVESSVRVIGEALQVVNFDRYARVLDVGGGYGGVLGALLRKFPDMSGTVLDLSYLKEGAEAYMRSIGVCERGKFLGGDFFESVPSGFDCHVLKYVIHDWGDSEALQILRACARALSGGGHLLLLERVLPDVMHESPSCQAIAQIDLAMMTTGGKERTVGEYADLLRSAGMRLVTVIATGAPCSVIQAVSA
jgi:SAM-dependent methyltransferase